MMIITKSSFFNLKDEIMFEDLEELEEFEVEDDLEVEEEDENPLKIIGALDYVMSEIPIICDCGAEIEIEGFGTIHKRNPEWKPLVDFIRSHMYYVSDERTAFICRHKDYENGEAWASLGVMPGFIEFPISPKDFNKKSLRRFVKLVGGKFYLPQYSEWELLRINEILMHEDFNLEEVDELLELMAHCHCIKQCVKVLDFRVLDWEVCEKLMNWGVLSPETFFTKSEHEIMVEIESSTTKMECRRFDEETKIPYILHEEFGEYLITSPQKYEDLWDEGDALHHCVGGYSKQVYCEDSQIYFIRKVSDPHTPLYTMEVKGDKINQLFGAWDKAPEEEVEEIILSHCEKYGWTPDIVSYAEEEVEFELNTQLIFDILYAISEKDFIRNL